MLESEIIKLDFESTNIYNQVTLEEIRAGPTYFADAISILLIPSYSVV